MIDLKLDRQGSPLLWHCVIGPLRRWRIIQRALGVRRIRCSYFGAQFDVDLQDGYGFDVATRRFEHGDLARFVRAIRRIRPAVFVDVGAHFGIYSCIAGAISPAIRVVALEPDPARFVGLGRQIEHHGLLARATLLRSAAGASHGTEVGLVHGSGGGAQDHMITVTHAGDGYCRASLVMLDKLDLPRGESITIKIDVDTYELDVLRGAADFFNSNRGYAQIEALGDNIAPVADWMAAAGWRTVERYGINSMFEKP
jgi:FkbM family methyltransferase